MKKSTFKRWALGLLVLVSVILIMMIMPGLNFELGEFRYAGIERISREHTLKGAIMIFGHGLRYEWHTHNNPSIGGPRGFALRFGKPYLRIGNTEIYSIRGR